MKKFLAGVLVVFSGAASSVPLEELATFGTAHQNTYRRTSPSLMVARGTGTDDFYVVEVDPVTGALPVSAVIDLGDTDWGTVGPATQRVAAVVGNEVGSADFGAGATSAQTLRVVLPTNQSAIPATQSGDWDIRDITGAVSLPTGAATEATLADVSTDTSSLDGKVPVKGQALMAASMPVAIASNQTALPAAQSGVWNVSNISGTVSLPTGAATQATLADILSDTSSVDSKLPSQGQAAMAASVPVVIASNQTALPASQSGAWSITNVSGTVSLPTGAATEATVSTLATEATLTSVSSTLSGLAAAGKAGRSKVDLITYAHSTPVTTSAYTQIIASTSAAIQRLLIFDSSGEGLILATGAAASEADTLYIPPGGFDFPVELTIASGTRLSVKALTANTSAGNLIVTALN